MKIECLNQPSIVAQPEHAISPAYNLHFTTIVRDTCNLKVKNEKRKLLIYKINATACGLGELTIVKWDLNCVRPG